MPAECSPAVFISYAREDTDAARRITDALRAFGVEVWFDQSELRGGDEWDARIREQIRTCDLFLPVISANTQLRREGYFRREWKLAADRTHDMAGGSRFVLPLIVDDTTESAALMPDEFKRVQITRLVRGVPTTQFVETVRRALEPTATPGVRGESVAQADARRTIPRRPWVAATIVLIALAAAVGGWWRFSSRDAPARRSIVLLMDSPFPDRVYDPVTLKSGGTNSDDITDALHGLPITIIKENTSSTWHREQEIVKVHPDLIVLHRSCFFTFPESQEDGLYPVSDNKLVAFLGYVSTLNPRVRFIVYSRQSFENDADAAKWREDAAVRFPVLAGRIETWRVPLDRATFRNALTAQELRASVGRALGLQLTARAK
jgi:hypothetical protein